MRVRKIPDWIPGWTWLCLAILVAIIFRVHHVLSDPAFSYHDATGQYWTQYPEAVQVKKHITILMEATIGGLYRLCVPSQFIPFHVFSSIIICILSSLSAIAVYGITKTFWKSSKAAVFSATFYLFNLFASITTLGHATLKQDLGLPLLFLHLYFFILSWNKGELRYSILSASFLYAALASWHLTQFIFMIEMLSIAPFILFDERDRSYSSILWPLLAACILGASTLPTLRSQGFVLSLPFLACLAGSTASWIGERRRVYRWLVWLFILAFGLLWGSIHFGEYSHVYRLLSAKIRHLGQLPSDPNALDWETLVMWGSNNLSPTWEETWIRMGALLIAGILGCSLRVFRLRSWTRQEIFFSLLMLSSACLYVFMKRLGVFLVFYLAVYAGYLISFSFEMPRIPRQARADHNLGIHSFTSLLLGPSSLIIACILFALNISIYRGLDVTSGAPSPGLHLELLKEIRQSLSPDAPILTHFSTGPSILAFTERPTIIHSKFETRELREKVQSFEKALFQDEETFWRFCQSLGVKFFVYETHMMQAGPGRIRGRVHHTGPIEDTAAYRFHYHPEKLKHFQWFWANPSYQLFEVLASGYEATPFERPYLPHYDPEKQSQAIGVPEG
jgi:hypothetical protein